MAAKSVISGLWRVARNRHRNTGIRSLNTKSTVRGVAIHVGSGCTKRSVSFTGPQMHVAIVYQLRLFALMTSQKLA